MKKEFNTSYFDIQAYLGTTKHMGGQESTQELIDACQITRDSVVLEVGCGVGATACYLAKQYGCRQVVGVDLRAQMIIRALERAQKEDLKDLVIFNVADVGALPFDNGHFDAVLCESVLTFVKDKRRAIDEMARVIRPGGCVSINEEIWLKPPPLELDERIRPIWDIPAPIPGADEWVKLMEQSGLSEVHNKIYRYDTKREASQVKRYRWSDLWLMISRSLELYIKRPGFRVYVKERRQLPKGLFDYLGYGLFVGTKEE